MKKTPRRFRRGVSRIIPLYQLYHQNRLKTSYLSPFGALNCKHFMTYHHFVGATNIVPAIPVTLPPWCPGLNFLNPSPFFGGRRAEALQKILHLEIFWGFRTRTAPAGGGAVPYRRRGSSGRPPVVGGAAVADPAGRRQCPGRAEGRQRGGEAEKEGGRGIDKASYSLLSLSPKPKALSR